MKTAVRPQAGIILLLVLVLFVGIALGLMIARPPQHPESIEEPEETEVRTVEESPEAASLPLQDLGEILPEVTETEESAEEPQTPETDTVFHAEVPAGYILRFAEIHEEPLHLAAGEVFLYDGFDWIWMKPLEGVPVNDMEKDQFQLIAGRPTYMGDAYETRLGVDVSEHQNEIDWKKVAQSGVDFAYIRIGRRGYTEGGLFDDPWFENNYDGASKAGLQVGVYFYSQAVSPEEAREEAQFVLDALDGRNLDLPVVFDWEKIDNEDADIARPNNLGMELRTECAVAFCEAIREGGYDASVYFNRNLGYYGYDLRQLTDYSFWFALPIAPPELCWPSFYYKMDVWQFSFTETVPGIEGETDLNLMFIPIETEE